MKGESKYQEKAKYLWDTQSQITWLNYLVKKKKSQTDISEK